MRIGYFGYFTKNNMIYDICCDLRNIRNNAVLTAPKYCAEDQGSSPVQSWMMMNGPFHGHSWTGHLSWNVYSFDDGLLEIC